MSPPSEEIGKPKLNKVQLELHGIFFFEDVCGDEELESWMQITREHLTRLRDKLPIEAKPKFAEELEIFRSSGQDSKEAFRDNWSLEPIETEPGSVYLRPMAFKKDRSMDLTKKEIGRCEAIREEAVEWRGKNENEPGWMLHLQQHFFQKFYKVHGLQDSFKNTFQRWELHQDLHWNECPQWRNENPKIRQLTGPKPDLTYAFPIIDTTSKTNARYFSDSQVETFSLPVLSKLRTDTELNLISAPTTKLREWRPHKHSEMNAADLICFPWAVVEAKRNKTSSIPGAENTTFNKEITKTDKAKEKFCYCQAANASAAALTLREKLILQSNDPSPSPYARAIFAFTCIGPSVKLWITFKDVHDTISMKCIWATSLELTWGVIALRMVIENMHEWVHERIKPEISRWIQSICKRPVQQTSLMPNGGHVKRTRRAASCAPPSEMPDITSSRSPTRTPRSKAPPAFSRGETAPAFAGRQRPRDFSPTPQPKGNIERIAPTFVIQRSPRCHAPIPQPRDNAKEDESDEEEEEDSNDSYEPQSNEEEEESASEWDSNIEDDEIEDLFDRLNLKPRGTDDEEEDGYCIEERHYPSHRKSHRKSRSPAKDSQLKKNKSKENKSKEDQTSRPGLRRRSSHF